MSYNDVSSVMEMRTNDASVVGSSPRSTPGSRSVNDVSSPKGSVLDVEISIFRDYHTPEGPVPIHLMSFMTSDKYADKIGRLWETTDRDEQNRIKATLPAATISGTFTKRGADYLVKHSGLIALDIDAKDNSHLKNFDQLGAQLCKIPQVAYVGRSASGKGWWIIVPIAYPERHRAQFRALVKVFAKMGIIIDPAPSNVASLRGYSYDPDAYFNHFAERFTGLDEDEAEKPKKSTYQPSTDNTRGKVEACLSEIQQRGIDITDGYHVWFSIGAALAATFGEEGREYFQAVSQYHPGYSQKATNRQYDHCMRHQGYDYDIATFFYHCQQHGITWKGALHMDSMEETRADQYPEYLQRMAKKNGSILYMIDKLDLEVPATPTYHTEEDEL